MTRNLSVEAARRRRLWLERQCAEQLAALAAVLPDAEQIVSAAYDLADTDYPRWANANAEAKLHFIAGASALWSVLQSRGLAGSRVHNHGPEEAAGLNCPERLVNGRLQGACMAEVSAPTPGASQ